MGAFKLTEPFIKKYKIILIIYTICVLLSYPLESVVIPEIFSSFFESLKNTNEIQNNEIFQNFFTKIGFFMFIIMITQMITSKLDVYLIPEFNEVISNTLFDKLSIKNLSDIRFLNRLLMSISLEFCIILTI